MNVQVHTPRLPRVSDIDIAAAAFVLWLMSDDSLLQGMARLFYLTCAKTIGG